MSEHEEAPAASDVPSNGSRTAELARLFLRLGVTSFGGPAAHIALMHDEVVRRRGWVTDERFVDLVGATNLIPGPNSTELAIHLGWDRARGRGLIVAGVSFILPAALIVGVLASIYVHYGNTPAFAGVLYGIKPVVIAIVANALVRLLPTAAKTRPLAILAACAAAGALLGVNELLLLFTGGIASAALLAARRLRTGGLASLVPLAAATADPSLGRLFLSFLRIGAVLYGSGYVILAFLQSEMVERHGWITDQQLLDAVAIGQVTPGPVFTTATFIGFVVAGFWGAVVATVGIFLPSFVFVALLTRIVDRMRSSAVLGVALDGINAAAIGLMAGVGVRLAGDALVDIVTVAVFVGTGILLWRTRCNSTWLIAGGAAIGIVHTLAT